MSSAELVTMPLMDNAPSVSVQYAGGRHVWGPSPSGVHDEPAVHELLVPPASMHAPAQSCAVAHVVEKSDRYADSEPANPALPAAPALAVASKPQSPSPPASTSVMPEPSDVPELSDGLEPSDASRTSPGTWLSRFSWSASTVAFAPSGAASRSGPIGG